MAKSNLAEAIVESMDEQSLPVGEPGDGADELFEELVLEEVSIDGMCGVY